MKGFSGISRPQEWSYSVSVSDRFGQYDRGKKKEGPGAFLFRNFYFGADQISRMSINSWTEAALF